jgi:hypothetical protein
VKIIKNRMDREDFARANGQKFHQQFEDIFAELATLRIEKVKYYGESAYRMEDEVMSVFLRYSDILRKHVRLESLTKMVVQGKTTPKTYGMLRDTYADFANYAMMGIQIIDNLDKEKTDESQLEGE